jgi:hypothetical protein
VLQVGVDQRFLVAAMTSLIYGALFLVNAISCYNYCFVRFAGYRSETRAESWALAVFGDEHQRPLCFMAPPLIDWWPCYT